MQERRVDLEYRVNVNYSCIYITQLKDHRRSLDSRTKVPGFVSMKPQNWYTLGHYILERWASIFGIQAFYFKSSNFVRVNTHKKRK